jgi:hypothetical protein
LVINTSINNARNYERYDQHRRDFEISSERTDSPHTAPPTPLWAGDVSPFNSMSNDAFYFKGSNSSGAQSQRGCDSPQILPEMGLLEINSSEKSGSRATEKVVERTISLSEQQAPVNTQETQEEVYVLPLTQDTTTTNDAITNGYFLGDIEPEDGPCEYLRYTTPYDNILNDALFK